MIGLFGSAFNPPTKGHLDAILQGLEVCDEVWLVPSICHAFGKKMLPFEVRMAMVEAFIIDIRDASAHSCAVEHELWDGKNPVHTIDVLEALKNRHPDKEFAFLCGPDNLLGFSRFERAEDILKTWRVLSLRDRSNIRSTDVRNARLFGDRHEHLVTPGVAKLIQEHNLYGV